MLTIQRQIHLVILLLQLEFLVTDLLIQNSFYMDARLSWCVLFCILKIVIILITFKLDFILQHSSHHNKH